jgi:hypothetical protein
MAGSVFQRLGYTIDDRGVVDFDDLPMTWADADAKAGRRLDRRRAWAFVGGKLCSLVRYTHVCSGCCSGDGYGSSRGGGCHECGYHGVVRAGSWVPAHD